MKNTYEWWLAACVYFEARGEDFAGQVAVVHVILNRVTRRQKSITGVIQADKQFSWYNGKKEPAITNWRAFIKCMDAVDYAICERYEGNTLESADHYHASYMAKYPYWTKQYKEVARIGKHIFYRS
jgi:spore germination cell wall hydrolase CwlJ-like protein